MPASDDRGNERAAGGEEAEEETKTDGWLNTYADMVTLLLTFFVIMVAMSSTDSAKLEMFLLAMSRDGITPEQFWEIQDKYNFEDIDLDSWDDMWPLPGWDDETPADAGGDQALQDLHDAMAAHIEDENLGDVISLSFNGDFLLITLASDILFASGRADITPEMQESAGMIGGMLQATFEPRDPFEIFVAGHTDSIPISTSQFPSNWELSMSRATNYLKELVNSSHLRPDFFHSRGCGEFRPVATNDTAEGRQQNRRVEVMVSLARDNFDWGTYDQNTGNLPGNVIIIDGSDNGINDGTTD